MSRLSPEIGFLSNRVERIVHHPPALLAVMADVGKIEACDSGDGGIVGINEFPGTSGVGP